MLPFVPAHSKCPRGLSGWMLVLCAYGRASSGFTRALVRGHAIDSNRRTADALQDGYMAGAGTCSAGKIAEFSSREIWDRRLTRLSAFLAKPRMRVQLVPPSWRLCSRPAPAVGCGVVPVPAHR